MPRIETVIDEQSEVTHEKLAIDAEEALGDPAKLGLKVRPARARCPARSCPSGAGAPPSPSPGRTGR